MLEATLAILVFIPMIQFLTEFAASYARDQAEALEVAQLSAVADSTASVILENLLTWTNETIPAGGSISVTGQALQDRGFIEVGTSGITTLGRDIEVTLFSPQSDRLFIFVRAVTPENKPEITYYPSGNFGQDSVGYIPASAPQTLVGVGLNFDLQPVIESGVDYQAGDIIAMRVLRYTADLRPYLHRTVNEYAPELSTMATDLDMDGHAILNVGNITADSVYLADTLYAQRIIGEVEITGNASVDSSLMATNITADAIFTTDMNVTSNLTSSLDTVLTNLTAQNVEINGLATINENLTVLNVLTVDSISATNAGLNDITANTASVETLVTDVAYFKKLDTSRLLTNELNVGICTGC